MADRRAPTPWDYADIVAQHLQTESDLLDIGTGGGETLLAFAPLFRSALGIDIDPGMIDTATRNAHGRSNVTFRLSSHELEGVPETFDIALNRHAPFSAPALARHLKPGGLFITQQVGERNMGNVKRALGQRASSPPVAREMFEGTGLRVVELREYDVEYTVKDVESLVFWLQALDLVHADIDGAAATDAEAFNRILEGSVTDAGFVTNEHRYLAIVQA